MKALTCSLALLSSLAAALPVIAADEPNEDMQQVLESYQKLGPKPIAQLTPEQARKQPSPADAVKATLKAEGKTPAMGGVKKQEMKYPTAGGSQPIRLYIPQGAPAQGQAALPVIVYYHGGGFVIADIDTYDASAMALAKKTNAIVASAEYRHAPEHKLPAAHQDAFAAYRWVLGNAKSFGGDAQRVAVAGESAGGNLAANVAIMARDQGVQAPTHMLLVYPVAGMDMNTESYRENANAKPLSKDAMAWFVKHSIDPQTKQKVAPMIDLVNADLKGLPSATVITAEIDPLMSEGKQLAAELKEAGVDVNYENFAGVTHEFFGMDAVVEEAGEAQDLAARDLRESFATTGDKQRATAAD